MLETVDEALNNLRRETLVLSSIAVRPADACEHILASPVALREDSPPFDRALVDGFAVRSSDARTGAILHIVGRQDAGGVPWGGVLSTGECLAINTGAVLPAGADAVLMVEHSQPEKSELVVTAMRDVAAEQGVQRRGAQGRAGMEVLAPGMWLTPAAVAAAISAGAEEVRVTRKPRVAVLSTGDELIEAGGMLGAGQIHNSNQPMLVGLVRGCGCEVVDLGSCGDVREEMRARMELGLREADVLVVTGGMSMGTRDLPPTLFRELGVEIHIEKVRMKPGKPFLFGTVGEGSGRKYVAGLPGNPVSAFVTFQIFVREMLRILGGEKGGSRFVEAEAGSVFPANGDREFFQPCALERRGRVLVATALDWRGSADILTLAKADGLVRRAAGAGEVSVGDGVEVLELG